MILAIQSIKQFYCDHCKRVHDILYFITKGESYCENCVSPMVKEQSVKVNQNREIIKSKED